MKLLITSERNLPQREGLIRFLDNIVPNLAKKFDASLILPESERSLDYKNVKNVFIGKSILKISDYSFPKISDTKYEQTVNDCDIVLINSLGIIGWRCVQQCIKQKKLYLVYIHLLEWKLLNKYVKVMRIFTFLQKHFIRKYLNNSKGVLVPSLEIKKELLKIGIKESLISIVELGVDTKMFSKRKYSKEKNEEKITIGFSGRFAVEKNIGLLYKVFLKLKEKYSVSLLLIGDGPERSKFKEAKITGFVNNVEDYLNKLDIYVMPSVEETTCLAALEALSCELPVIANKIGMIKNIINDGVNGYFFKEEFELEQKLIYLIENKKERIRLGKNARKSVLKLSWNKTVEGIEREILRNMKALAEM